MSTCQRCHSKVADGEDGHCKDCCEELARLPVVGITAGAPTMSQGKPYEIDSWGRRIYKD